MRRKSQSHEPSKVTFEVSRSVYSQFVRDRHLSIAASRNHQRSAPLRTRSASPKRVANECRPRTTSTNVDKVILADVHPRRRQSASLCVENAFLRHTAKDGNLFHCVLLNATEAPKTISMNSTEHRRSALRRKRRAIPPNNLLLNQKHRSKAKQIWRHQNVISQKNQLSIHRQGGHK